MTKKYDSIQLEYLTKAEKLRDELMLNGFLACRIKKGEDRTDFQVVFFDGTHEYNISRDYNEHVHVTRSDYTRYDNVSLHIRGDTWKKYRGDNVKVITPKKVQRLIDNENAYHDEMASLEKSAATKVADFISEAHALEKKGFKINWSKERDGKINSGTIERNGIEFYFEISGDGYVSKKIKISYAIDNSLDAFVMLSNNAYKV